MPDQVELGKMRFVREPLLTSGAGDPDENKVIRLVQVDCRPPPGSTTQFVWPNSLLPLVIERFVQSPERTRLSLLGAEVNPADGYDEVISRMFGGFGIRPLGVYFGEAFKPMLSVVPCHTVDVYLRVKYNLYNVRVVAIEDLTVAGESFPATDELASFRVAEPFKYRFETLTTFNPDCCTERPPHPGEQKSDWFPLEVSLVGPPFGVDKLWFDDRRGKLRIKTSF